MPLINGTSYTFDAIFYNDGKFVDLRSLDKINIDYLNIAVSSDIKDADFDTMTFSVDISMKKRFGSVMVDADNNDELECFQKFWIFPCSRKLGDKWSVLLKAVSKVVFDVNGKIVNENN